MPLHHRVHDPATDIRADRSPVLLVHGMGGTGATWHRQVRMLRAVGRRVITVDLRGHGRSPAAGSYRFTDFAGDLVALVDRLGLGRVDVVGHSLGAMVSATLAQHHPDRVGSVVLEEMPLPLRPRDPVPQIPQVRPSLGEIARATGALLRDPAARRGFDRGRVEPAARQQFLAPLPDFWDRLPTTTAPMLLIRGTRPGSMVDPARVDAVAQAAPAMTVAAVDSGHSVHRDRPREFTALMTGFLRD